VLSLNIEPWQVLHVSWFQYEIFQMSFIFYKTIL